MAGYGRHMMPKAGRVGPKGYENLSHGVDLHQAAWITVVTCRGYERCEHWLRARYVFERENIGPHGESRVRRFEALLAATLDHRPFDPDKWDREDPHANVRLAYISSTNAAFMAGVTVRAIQDWCSKNALRSERRGSRLYIRIGELIDILKARDQKRYWIKNQKNNTKTTKVAS